MKKTTKKRRSAEKKKLNSTLILILVFIAGLSLLLYPVGSNWWNSFHQSGLISQYEKTVANMDEEDYSEIFEKAYDYNRRLAALGFDFGELTDEMKAEYEQQLSFSDEGMMGYIDIPVIRCRLPVYHGTDESVLQTSVGHLEWSSLPVGGPNTHTVVSGHRGLPSAKLFTDIDKLVEGDIFFFNILDQTLAYEVDQILIVLPEEVGSMKIEEGQDLCTLVTCTPYGVNSHRLLVRGHRIDYKPGAARVAADALQVDKTLVASAIAAPMLIALLIWLLVSTSKKEKKRKKLLKKRKKRKRGETREKPEKPEE